MSDEKGHVNLTHEPEVLDEPQHVRVQYIGNNQI
jgi:hypothetical protein